MSSSVRLVFKPQGALIFSRTRFVCRRRIDVDSAASPGGFARIALMVERWCEGEARAKAVGRSGRIPLYVPLFFLCYYLPALFSFFFLDDSLLSSAQ